MENSLIDQQTPHVNGSEPVHTGSHQFADWLTVNEAAVYGRVVHQFDHSPKAYREWTKRAHKHGEADEKGPVARQEDTRNGFRWSIRRDYLDTRIVEELAFQATAQIPKSEQASKEPPTIEPVEAPSEAPASVVDDVELLKSQLSSKEQELEDMRQKLTSTEIDKRVRDARIKSLAEDKDELKQWVHQNVETMNKQSRLIGRLETQLQLEAPADMPPASFEELDDDNQSDVSPKHADLPLDDVEVHTAREEGQGVVVE